MTNVKVPLSVLFPDQNTDDEERMDYLFAEFPPNSKLNPEQYSKKIELWNTALINYCRAVNSSILSFNDVSSIKFKGKTALAFYTCWEKKVNDGKLLKLEDYKKHLLQSWSGWVLEKSIVNPLKWVGSSLFSYSDENAWKMDRYVLCEFLSEETAAVVEILRKKITNGSDSILIPYFDLAQLCVDILSNEEEFELVLLLLQSRKMVTMFEVDKTKMLKFCLNPGWSLPKVSKEELAKLKLEKSLKSIQDEVNRLNERVEVLTKEAVMHNKAGQKGRAIRCLKLKRIIEKDLDVKLGIERNLEALLYQLENNKSMGMVINAMKSSSQVMKKSSVTIDELDNTVDEIEEVMSRDREINDTMKSMNERWLENCGIFDEDLMAELEQLQRDPSAVGDSEPDPDSHMRKVVDRSRTTPPKRKSVCISNTGDDYENGIGIPMQALPSNTSPRLSASSNESPSSKLRRATETRVPVLSVM